MLLEKELEAFDSRNNGPSRSTIGGANTEDLTGELTREGVSLYY
jgi:hypothetical protein